MASTNFLAGLGAALTEGSKLSGRARLEKQEEEQQRFEREQRLAQMALQRQQFDLERQGFEAEQGDREYGRVKDILSVQAPGAEVDSALASRAEAVGLGGRLSPAGQMTLESRQFGLDPNAVTGQEISQLASPAAVRARTIVPTFEQEGELADRQFQQGEREFTATQREQVRRAQAAVNEPGFYKMPEHQRALVWQQAGFDGQAPQSMDEWKERERFQNQLATSRGISIAQASAAAMNPQRTEWVIRTGPDGKKVTVPINSTKDYQPGDVPYDPVAARQGGGKKAAVGADYIAERQGRMRDAISVLRGDTTNPETGEKVPGNRINRNVAGFGAALQYLPESDARAFAGDVRNLLSNIGFNELTEMRAAAASGGALGNVSDFENRQLQAVLGTLDQYQSPEDIQKVLTRMEASLDRWERAKQEHAAEAEALGIAVPGRPTFNGQQVVPPAGTAPTPGQGQPKSKFVIRNNQ